MTDIHRGRFTAEIEGPFVVFLLGMRINKLRAVGKWMSVIGAMRPMVEHLMTHKELGLMHAHTFAYWRGAMLVQYWRSFEQLERFARDPALNHLEPWKRFNRAVGAAGTVGIWHETYLVQAGQYEVVYGNMPRTGLAMAGTHGPAVGARETARRRLGEPGEPAVPTYDNPPGPAP